MILCIDKTKISGGTDTNNIGTAQKYLDDLERAKQESLKTAVTHDTNINNNCAINTKDFSNLNSPNIATYGVTDNH